MTGNQRAYIAILSTSMGKNEVDWLCNEAMQSEANFAFFFQLIFTENVQVAWHAAWVTEKVSEKAPRFFHHEHIQQLTTFTHTNRHDGLQRLCLSILFNLPLLQPVSVQFVNRRFAQMLSPKETVGVQVLSMKLLERICGKEPDFIPELVFSLENVDETLYSKGFAAAKKNAIKKLKIRMKTL